jgi:hypothetical protein
MSSGKLFAVGTIEEDFKKIGIFTEAAPVAPVETIAESAPAVDEGIKLLKKVRPTGKVRLMRRKQKLLRRRNRSKLKRKAKMFRKSARGKRFLRKYKQVLKRYHGHAPKNKRISLKMGLDKVSNLIEEVSEIVTAIDGDAQKETVKTFANLALIANKLAENFACACNDLEIVDEAGEELDLCGAAEHFESLASTAADLAESLHASIAEGVEFEGTSEEVSATFASMMSDVLEGLDVFADISEDSDDTEPEESDAAEEDSEEGESEARPTK